MPYPAASQAHPTPRPSRYPAPRDTPRHGELIAVLAVAALLAHLLLAQLTLLLAAAMYAAGRVGRWRPQWLAVPAGAGALWVLAIGPARAADGLTAGPRQVLAYLGAIGRYPGHLLRPEGAFAGLGHWLPEQFPLALILAAAEAFGVCWLQRRVTGGRPWRTGLVVAARRRATTASIRSGGVVTRDGCRVGLDVATGRAAEITWTEAEGGVLCAGTACTENGFMLAHAAIRRRKPLIVIDLTGSPWLAESLAAACAPPGAPLHRFGADGPGYYEPLRGGDPARAAALVMAMIDWSGTGDQQRRSCAAYLADALAVQAAAPGDRRVPVLDDLVRLLTPDALRERASLIPAYHPRRDVLADRASVSAGLLQADPATVAAPAAQLPRLRASALGRWLEPGPPGATRISLGRTVRERAVAVFSLDRSAHGDAATMVAGLATADLAAVCGELHGMSVPGDSLAWINGCEALGDEVLADLVERGAGAGTGVVLGTASGEVADRLAAEVRVLVAGGPHSAALAGTFAGGGQVSGAGEAGSAPDAAVADAATFTLAAKGSRQRVLPRCRHVPARVGGPPETAGTSAHPGTGGRLRTGGRRGTSARLGTGGRPGASGRPGTGARLGTGGGLG
jgi:hypothetical protein